MVRSAATDIDIQAREILKIKDIVHKILAKHTGQNLDKIAKDTERDYFMDSEDALKYGIIDKIITEREVQDSKK